MAETCEMLPTDDSILKAIRVLREQKLSEQSYSEAQLLRYVVALIERLTAELARKTAENARLTAKVERLKPKPMTLERAVEVMESPEHHGRWRTVGFDIIAVAEKLERDAGPIAGPLEQEEGA